MKVKYIKCKLIAMFISLIIIVVTFVLHKNPAIAEPSTFQRNIKSIAALRTFASINGPQGLQQDGENKGTMMWDNFYFTNDVRKQYSFSSQAIPVLQPVLDEDLRAHINVKLHQLLESNGTDATRSRQIALATGITSHGINNVILQNITLEKLLEHFLFFRMFSSFCETASPGYFYHIYLAFDSDDSFFVDADNRRLFLHAFLLKAKELCLPKGILPRLHLVWCLHRKMSAWASNDAIMEAYWDNMEYVYRILDDAIMMSKGWLEMFIDTMQSYNPRNVGVAGPKQQHFPYLPKFNEFDFTHKTHIDIFGFHWPRVFRDHHPDIWITEVYQPKRSTTVQGAPLNHTRVMGSRYTPYRQAVHSLPGELLKGKYTIARYIEAVKKGAVKTCPKATHIIAMSLYSTNPIYLYGAMRNAQLAPVIYPGWTLRFYISKQKKHALPDKFIYRMKMLGAQFTEMDYGSLPPPLWRYKVMLDPAVEYFLIRDPDSHLSDREHHAVEEWLRSDKSVHCMRDLPEHGNRTIVDGLWGMKGKTQVAKEIQSAFQAMISDSRSSVRDIEGGLLDVLYPLFKDSILCHDSVSRNRWPNSKDFPTALQRGGRVGQKYSVNHEC